MATSSPTAVHAPTAACGGGSVMRPQHFRRQRPLRQSRRPLGAFSGLVTQPDDVAVRAEGRVPTVSLTCNVAGAKIRRRAREPMETP
jgi:hypothetical protein